MGEGGKGGRGRGGRVSETEGESEAAISIDKMAGFNFKKLK